MTLPYFHPNFKWIFLKNSENKDDLGRYLAKKIIEFHLNQNLVLVVTYEHTILSSDIAILDEESIVNCTSEEADQRVIRHVLNLNKKTNYSDILVCTYDTDVLMLLIGYSPYLEKLKQINLVCQFGFGNNKKFFSINDIAKNIGYDICKALPFFHAFSGCDTVSSFFNFGKTKFWDTWIKYQHQELLTKVFQELSNQPKEVTDSHMDIIEDFVKVVYYPHRKNLEELNVERLNHFAHQSDSNLRVISPFRDGLKEHVKRAALQAGWIWSEARTNVQYQKPEFWGWEVTKGKYLPKWQCQIDGSPNISDICKICTCQKALCKNCKCAKDKLKCLPFCSCHKKCETEIH